MKTTNEKLVIGVFHNAGDARRVIEELRDAKFSDKKIGLLTHDKEGDPDVKSFKDMEGNKAGTGAAIGAAAGAGGGALWALGIAAGLLPAIGPVIGGGILAAVVASAGAGGVAGVIAGALVGLGVDDEEAAYYDEEFRKGRTIVVVKPGDRGDVAYDIMMRHHSQNRYLRPTQVDAGAPA